LDLSLPSARLSPEGTRNTGGALVPMHCGRGRGSLECGTRERRVRPAPSAFRSLSTTRADDDDDRETVSAEVGSINPLRRVDLLIVVRRDAARHRARFPIIAAARSRPRSATTRRASAALG
jgi:hypothetical protein